MPRYVAKIFVSGPGGNYSYTRMIGADSMIKAALGAPLSGLLDGPPATLEKLVIKRVGRGYAWHEFRPDDLVIYRT